MQELFHSPRSRVIHMGAMLSASALICFGLIIFVIEVAQAHRPILGTVCLFLYWLNFFGLTRSKRWLNLLALLGAGFCILFSLVLIATYIHERSEVNVEILWIVLLYALLHSFCFFELLHRYREVRSHLRKA
jgi:hypothetical protein